MAPPAARLKPNRNGASIPKRKENYLSIFFPTTAEIRYLSHRRGAEDRLSSCFQYRPVGVARLANPGTLEFFLVERYTLFAQLAGQTRPWSGRVHHPPYPLVDAEVTEWDDAAFELDGLKRPGRGADHVVMSPGIAVEVFALHK
jgi:uncharacterized protein YqjF (DUF2071 family)